MTTNSTAEKFSDAKYWIALSLVTLMIMISFAALYIFVRQVETTAAVINVSGRQRMLSQQIPLYAQMILRETSFSKRKALKDVLEDTVDLMEQSHHSLIEGTVSSSESKIMSKKIRGIFFFGEASLDQMVADYIGHSRQFLLDWETTDSKHPSLIYISREGPTSIVTKLDVLVSQYQLEGEEAIAIILKIERVSLFFCLLLLVTGAFYIFRKLGSRVQKQYSELKFSKESLDDAEHLSDQLRHALDEHSLVSITDINGKIMYANSKFSEVSGYSVAELINANHSILGSDFHDEDFFNDLWKTITSGRTWRGEICNKTKDGKLYWVFSTIVPFLNKDTQKPEYFVAIRTEITQQKKMQENLDKLSVEAMAANEIKSNFVTNISHELRTPLNHIIGFSQILEMKTQDANLLENVGYIKNAGHELLDKINAVLTMVDLDNSEKTAPDLINICALIETDFLPYFRTLAEKSKRKFTINIPDQEIYVMADAADLLKAFRNVAKNAVQFSCAGDIVGMSVSSDDNVVSIAIFDTGPGLPSHILSGNLEPFSIGEHVITKINSGMGLGLPLAKKICVQNGGEIELESSRGLGSKIHFKFPVAHPKTLQKYNLQ